MTPEDTQTLLEVAQWTQTHRNVRSTIRQLAKTEENYLLKEMGFSVARKHRGRLRRIARLAGFALPALLTFVTLLFGGVIGIVGAGLAIASATLGLLVERWLFFAEATHTVTLYYGAEVA